MAIAYVYIKDKDGNATKMAADSFDSAMYPNQVAFDPLLAASIGMNSEEQHVQIRGLQALCSVIASECLLADHLTTNASIMVRVSATAGALMSGDSADAADAAAGSGAQTVYVTGVGPAYVEQFGIYTCNGTTAAPLVVVDSAGATATGKWMAINKAEVNAALSGANAGAITIVDGSAAIYNGIALGLGVSKQAAYLVPVNKSLYLKNIDYRLSGAGSVRIQYIDYTVTGLGVTKVLWLKTAAGAVEDASSDLGWIKIPGKCRVEVIGYGAAGSILIEATINAILKDDV